MSISKTSTGSHGREKFAETIRRLANAQKPAATGSPAYSRFINRRIGRILAAGAFHVGMTPNQVTLISATFTTVGIVVIAVIPPSLLSGLLIALTLLIGYAFDSADGQLARLNGGGTPAGEWLDHVIDSAKASALHLAVLISWFRFYDIPDHTLLIPIIFTLIYAVYLFTLILTDQLRRAHPSQMPAPAKSGWLATLRSAAILPADYGMLCLVFIILPWTGGFILAYGVLLVGTSLLLVVALPKWYREMTRLI